MLSIGFLLSKNLPHQSAWELAGYNYRPAFAHCYEGAEDLPSWVSSAPTVPTSWADTVKAHYQLYKAFVLSEATHMLISSESCVPLSRVEDIENALEEGKSYAYNFWNDSLNDWTKYRIAKCPVRRYRNAWRAHEQWYIISKEHAQIMLKNEKFVIPAFTPVPANNEHFMGTVLNAYGIEVEFMRITYVDWTLGQRHPKKYQSVDDLPKKASRFFFARKVVETPSKILNTYNPSRPPDKTSKVAIVCAVYGGYDSINTVVPQSVECDKYYFTDTEQRNERGWDVIVETPPIESKDPRMQSKWYKLQAHKHPILKQYDNIIWLDGRIDIKNRDAVDCFIKNAGDYCAFVPHPERECIYQEYEVVNSYARFRDKYKDYDTEGQIAHYRKEIKHPAAGGLWAGTYFCRAVNERTNRLFDDWWAECVRWGTKDQYSLPVVFYKHGFPRDFGFNLWKNQYISTKNHLKAT